MVEVDFPQFRRHLPGAVRLLGFGDNEWAVGPPSSTYGLVEIAMLERGDVGPGSYV
jgi:hypothetical protein